MEPDRERQLAEALADLIDRGARLDASTATLHPELTGELEALAEIDRAIEPCTTLPPRLSGHKILAEIGSGGMGRVLLAFDEALGRKVAIKTLAPRYAEDPSVRTRFMNEARATARLSHPNIARIYNLGPPSEEPHFVMEFLEGGPLTTVVAPLSFHQKAELLLKVAAAVEFLHGHGMLHRDLKPANILVGPDLEPKLLDFGLALDLGGGQRLSRIGEIAGTPEYLSPEQAAGVQELGVRSDIFSLGSVLYEVLTGERPFHGESTGALLEAIRTQEPVLPGRRNPGIPRDLQNICLKALEKNPSDRYASAGEMADDLRRFLAGEAVHAEPAAYARMIAGRVGQHLRDLEGWRSEQVISEAEYSAIRKRYDRLLEREDSWILEARRLTLPQVALYLGAWIVAVGAAFLTFFRYPSLAGAPGVAMAWMTALPMAWIGARQWQRGQFRVAIAYLLTFCLLVPIAVLVTVEEARLFTTLTLGQAKFELFHQLKFGRLATNAQLWWSILAGLPVCWWLRRFTRAPVFSLMFATTAALLCLATLLRMGMLDWLDRDPGRVYFDLIPCAILFLAAGYLFERFHLSNDSQYFYPFAVAFTWAALTGVATVHEPYQQWLKASFPWTRGQVEYLFLINAAIYTVLDRVCERLPSAQLHAVGKSFQFVVPGHVMTSLLLLGMLAQGRHPAEARLFEWLLPAAAWAFVFASIPRQMKNFFVSGLVFFAIGVYRLQQHAFPNQALWPAALLAVGLLLMVAATNYAPIKVGLLRLTKSRRGQ